MPIAIEQALLTIEEAGVHYQLLLRTPGQLDSIQLEPISSLASDAWAALQHRAVASLAELGVAVPVRVVAPGTLPRSGGKAMRMALVPSPESDQMSCQSSASDVPCGHEYCS